MTVPEIDSVAASDRPADWAALYGVLAECLKEPSEAFVAEAQEGVLSAELDRHAARVNLELPDAPPAPESHGALYQEYLSLFEGFETPFAPPVESPYKTWYGGAQKTGLMDGPSALDARRRYEAIGATPPTRYPADHLALLLEYASLLLEAGAVEDFEAFAVDHLDWLSAFDERVAGAAADAPFYRAVVALVVAVVGASQ